MADMRLYGKRPIIERLKAAPQTVQAIYLQQGTDAPEVVHAVKAAGKSFISQTKEAFQKNFGAVHAQGVAADVADFEYADFDALVRAEPRPTLILLDRITDPQNLGAMLRTLSCLGGFALVLPRFESADVNETALRIACGGENYMPVALVTNLAKAAEQAKAAGYWIAGAAAEGGDPLPTADWPTPLAVVIGSEGDGIRPGLEKHLDLKLTLPMPGAKLSYNAATAAAMIGYEITRRRLTKGP